MKSPETGGEMDRNSNWDSGGSGQSNKHPYRYPPKGNVQMAIKYTKFFQPHLEIAN